MISPSWSDYGTYDESAYPGLWSGVVGYWAPCRGPTGLRLHDVSRGSNWGTLTNMDAATDWVVSDGRYVLDFDGANDVVSMDSTRTYITDAQPFTIMAWANVRSLTNVYSKIILLPSDDASGNAYEFGISSDSAGGYLGLLAGTASSYARIRSGTAANTMTTAGMVLYGITYNGRGRGTASNYTFYFNTQAISPLSAGNFSTVSRRLQLSLDANNNRFDGQIAEVIVWHRQFTQNDVAAFRGLGPGGMLQRRSRRRAYVEPAGFRAHYASQRSRIIGGGLK